MIILSLPVSVAGFVLAAVVVGVSGVLLTARAERLARVTGLGQAVTGAVFIGATTSLSGLVTSGTAAVAGHASLAVSNSLGGIAVQTVFLAAADMLHRKANLEHAAASEPNLQQSALLIVLLALPLLGMATPNLQIGWLHPTSVGLLGAYLFGVHLVHRAHQQPMWQPRLTAETEREAHERAHTERTSPKEWLVFAGLAASVAVAGWVIAISGASLAQHFGLRESLVGGLLTSISTSLPELVVALAAVRRGALSLAVGDILGGNAFDVLFLSLSDALYVDGSIYAAIGADELLWVTVTILMAAVLQMGLLRRQKHGLANIGFESITVLVIYLGAVAVLLWR